MVISSVKIILGRLEHAYRLSVISILLVSGLIKAVSVLGNSLALGIRDPLFIWFTNREMLAAAAIFELAVARALCADWQGNRLSLVWVLWISSLFITYRLGLWLIGYQGPCACLGRATAWLNISPNATDLLMKSLLTYMFVGSVLIVSAKIVLKRKAV